MNKLISIVIPCIDEKYNTRGLLEDIANQKRTFEIEIIKITNTSPSGKARNTGAQEAEGEILIFIDCDIRLGNKFVLSNLVNSLGENKDIDVVCASVRIPTDASKFQIRYAKEIPHSQTPIVEKITEVFIPTVACCAVSKETFFKIGMFNQEILRGVDPEFAFRLRKEGYRAAISPDTWCYHSLPNNIIELIKVQTRDGSAVAFADTFYPHLNIDVDPRGVIYVSERKIKFIRGIRFIITFFNAILEGKILLLFSKIIYIFSYLNGLLKYRVIHFLKRLTQKQRFIYGVFYV